MRYATQTFCLVLLSLQPLASAQHCEPDWCRGYPGWYASGDAIFLQRGKPRSDVLVVADRGTVVNVADDVPLLSSGELRFNEFESGFRTTIGRSFGNGLALEGSFLRVDGWEADRQITTNGFIVSGPDAEGLSPPLPINATIFNADTFFEAIQQSALYESELHSAEINLKASWKHHQFIRSELVGIRYLEVRERFVLASQDEVDSTPAFGMGTYTINTDNNLLGAHYGQELGLPLFGCVLISTKVKAGVFFNDVEMENEIFDNGQVRVRGRDTEDEVCFVGEVNVNLEVKVTNALSVHGGYNCLWVEGVALAPEQNYPLAFSGIHLLNDNGGLFYHGFSAGVQLSR
jgi:hypothetical protein